MAWINVCSPVRHRDNRYNLSVKLNGARVTTPRAGVLPVSPFTSAGPVADTYSVFIMWKKCLCSSTWLPPNNRARFNSGTLWHQTPERAIFNAVMVAMKQWSHDNPQQDIQMDLYKRGSSGPSSAWSVVFPVISQVQVLDLFKRLNGNTQRNRAEQRFRTTGASIQGWIVFFKNRTRSKMKQISGLNSTKH